MKTPSDDLFNLVKSLETQEKVYLKKYITKNSGPNNYIRMFDVMDKMKVYDEILLQSKIKNTDKSKPFKWLKRRLSETILKCLSEYHSDTSTERILQNQIHQASILFQKKLHKSAGKIIEKSERLAMNAGLNKYLLIILDLKILYWKMDRRVEELNDYYNDQGFEKEIKYSNEIKQHIEWRKLSTSLDLINFKRGNLTQTNFLENFNNISQSELLQEPNKHISIIGKMHYYQLKFTQSYIHDEVDIKTYKDQKMIINLIEANQNLLPFRAVEYMGILSNMIIILSYTAKDSKELSDTYKKAQTFYLSLNSKKRSKLIQSIYGNITSNYIGQIASFVSTRDALNAWEQINTVGGINNSLLRISTAIVLNSNLAFCYLSVGNFHAALKHINKVAAVSINSVERLDTQFVSKFYGIMTHYELKNFDILPFLVNQVTIFLKKHKLFNPFEKEFLQFFARKYLSELSKTEVKNAFVELRIKLANTIKNPEDDTLFIPWIDSKIENKSIAKILSEKRNKPPLSKLRSIESNKLDKARKNRDESN